MIIPEEDKNILKYDQDRKSLKTLSRYLGRQRIAAWKNSRMLRSSRRIIHSKNKQRYSEGLVIIQRSADLSAQV